METTIRAALRKGGIADVTTIGRKTGSPHRIEIFLHRFDGKYYLVGRPGLKKDWFANLAANPHFTLHLKNGASADLPVAAETVGFPRWALLDHSSHIHRELGQEPR